MVNSESDLLGKSYKTSCIEYAKNLIEEFGFIPIGGLRRLVETKKGVGFLMYMIKAIVANYMEQKQEH